MHSKLEPDSVEAKEKLAEVEVVLPPGPPLMLVSGGVVSIGGGPEASTVQLRVAGVGSMLPVASLARTEKLWLPSLRVE